MRAKTFKGQSKKNKGEQHEFAGFSNQTLNHLIRLTLTSFFASSHLLGVLQMDISLSVHRHAAIWWLIELPHHFRAPEAVTALVHKKIPLQSGKIGWKGLESRSLPSCGETVKVLLKITITSTWSSLFLPLALVSVNCSASVSYPLQRADDPSQQFPFQEISQD